MALSNLVGNPQDQILESRQVLFRCAKVSVDIRRILISKYEENTCESGKLIAIIKR